MGGNYDEIDWNDIHRVRKKVFRCSQSGWTFRTCRSHILGKRDQYAWKRELSCFQGQSLPDAVFPSNGLELCHNETGIRIRFCALEALRSWSQLDLPPVRIPEADFESWQKKKRRYPSIDYDYTYTTLYPGGVDVINRKDVAMMGSGTDNKNNFNLDHMQPDSSSFIAKKTIDADFGPRAQLRKPICKCKGDGGRAPFVQKSNTFNNKGGFDNIESTAEMTHHPLKKGKDETFLVDEVPPKWRLSCPEQHAVDIEGMIKKFPTPIHREDVHLYEDDLHDNGTCFLKVKLYVTPDESWAVLLRFFVRINEVMARVIDTRFTFRRGENHVLRERSWREGAWGLLVEGLGHHHCHRISLETINDSIAAQVLPLRQPVVTEYLLLNPQMDGARGLHCPTTEIPLVSRVEANGNQSAFKVNMKNCAMTSAAVSFPQSIHRQGLCLLTNDSSFQMSCPVPAAEFESLYEISAVFVSNNGKLVEAIQVPKIFESRFDSTSPRWKKTLLRSTEKDNNDKVMDQQDAMVLSLQISPDITDGGRLVLGDDRGWCHVWRLSTGEPLFDFPVAASVVRAVELTSGNRNQSRPVQRQSARLWVDHVAWSKDGKLLAAAAGRSAVLVLAHNEDEKFAQILSSLESRKGTITGISFGGNNALAVASYGEVQWLAKEDDALPSTLKRGAAAIQCIDISPDGEKVAVGFLDKTLRVYTNNNDATDWVGFNAPLKSVSFSRGGSWLAAMGGSTILVLPKTLDLKSEPSIICRTRGQTAGDGCDGTCYRFATMKWSPSEVEDAEENIIVALDAQVGMVHVFDVRKTNQAWPRRAQLIMTVRPPFSRPMPSTILTTVARFTKDTEEPQDDVKNIMKFVWMDRKTEEGPTLGSFSFNELY